MSKSNKKDGKKSVYLRKKELAKGVISLYLDYYQEGQRKYEFLKLYYKKNPSTPEEREARKEKLELAEDIRRKRESQYKHAEYGITSPQLLNRNFIDYFQEYYDSYTKKDKRMLKGALDQFREYIKTPVIKTGSITPQIIEGYRDHLLKNFNGSTPHSYFSRFKKAVRHAYKKGYFYRNPAEGISCPVNEEITKDILSIDEIHSLVKAECGNPEVKRAFLFCLNTGLRFAEANNLQWKDIQDSQIKKRQSKTGQFAYIDLNNSALKLMGEPGEPENFVFNLPSHTACSKDLKTWKNRAGITKHITWHCSRHTFATLLLSNNANVKTVQGLLGHSSIKYVQRYTRIIDELKKEAVNKLPDLNL